MVRKAKIAASILIMALASGCGSMYKSDSECPGYVEDGVCKDLREVYESTNDWDREAYREQLRARAEAKENRRSERTLLRRGGEQTERLSTEEVNQSTAMPYLLADSHPRPILTQAIAVRVYVDPYQDSSGRLHKPGYVYVQATQPEWIFGSEQAEGSRVVTPLIID